MSGPAVLETTDFAAALSTLRADTLLVRPGVTLPPLAAARLAWAAARHPGAATVSPVLDSLAASTSFAPVADRASRDWAPWVYRVDECCADADASESSVETIPASCVFIRASAAADVLAAGAPMDWESFTAACRQRRYAHLLAHHVYALALDGDPTGPLAPAAHRANVERRLLEGRGAPSIADRCRPRQLHVLHGWGGGAEQWVRDYCAHDSASIDFVLTTECRPDGSAIRLILYRRLGDPLPLESWPLDPAIEGTRDGHSGYAAALAAVVSRLGIGRIFVSSLVGHSLECLRTGLPTVMVAHDYYPFCPAFGITFGETCRSCDGGRLATCRRDNRLHRVFPGTPASEWLRLRKAFLQAISAPGVTLAAPSESVRSNYMALEPAIAARIRIVPHGTPPLGLPAIAPSPDRAAKLRVLVPGRLNEAKGELVLDALAPDAASFADLILLGCGAEAAAKWSGRPGVLVVENYPHHRLGALLEELRPDCALLPSIVPETFSYTLQEMFAAAIPPVAARVGAFEDRIEDGVTGFLADPGATPLLAVLRHVSEDRAALTRVHERLRVTPVRSAADMIRDYDSWRDSPHSAEAYYAGPPPEPLANPGVDRVQLFWRSTGGGYSEGESAFHAAAVSAENRTLRFAFPPQFPALGALRLDPGTRPGVAVISRLALFDSSGAMVAELPAAANNAPSHQIVPLAVEGTGVCLCMTGDDPHFELPLPEVVRGKLSPGGEVEVTIAHPPLADFLDGLLTQMRGDRDAAIRQALEAARESAEASARAAARDFETALTGRDARIAEARAEVAERDQTIWRNHNSAAAELQKERERLLFIVETKDAAIRSLAASVDKAYELLRLEHASRAHEHAFRCAAEAQLEDLRNQARALRESLSWRITGPLRWASRPFLGGG